MMSQTTAGGHETAKTSFQLRLITPFLDFKIHFAKPFTVSHPTVAAALPRFDDPGTGKESIMTPRTLFSFALAAAAQSAADKARGNVRRVADGARDGCCGALLLTDARLAELGRLAKPYDEAGSPSPILPLLGKYDDGSDVMPLPKLYSLSAASMLR
jgi:hypothetical protein